MRILGVDPGTNITGYAILEDDGSSLSVLVSGKINLSKLTSAYEKLNQIFQKISAIIKSYNPHEMSIEAPFYGKNVQSMLKLGRAQGVAIAAAMNSGLKVVEYSPRKVKQAVTGNGNASKDQIAMMVKSILQIKKLPDTFDETDAIALALAHYYQRTKRTLTKSYSGWTDFLKQNPHKIKR